MPTQHLTSTELLSTTTITGITSTTGLPAPPTIPPSTTTTVNPPDPAAVVCAASVWQVTLESGSVSEYTGGRTSVLTMANTSTTTCVLDGYPAVTIRGSDGRALPFTIGHDGSQIASPAPPRRIEVRAGNAAYAVLDKFRCDLPGGRDPASVTVTLPGRPESIPVAITGSGWPGYLTYCGDGDPGSLLAVTAIVANLNDAFRALH